MPAEMIETTPPTAREFDWRGLSAIQVETIREALKRFRDGMVIINAGDAKSVLPIQSMQITARDLLATLPEAPVIPRR